MKFLQKWGGNELPTPDYNVILLNEQTGTISVKKPEPIPNIILTYADGHSQKFYDTHEMTASLIEGDTPSYQKPNTTLVSAVINDEVGQIANNGFAYCSNLSSVTINGKHLNRINNNAFLRCNSLTSVGLKGSGASVEIPESVTSLGYGVFTGCENLISAVIPNTVRYGALNSTFSECYKLANVTLPTTIDDSDKKSENTFWGCSALTSVVLPENITTMGSSTFDRCFSLTSIGPKGSGASVEIPEGVIILNDCFDYCSGLTSITIPSTVKMLSGTSFENAQLRELTIPDTVDAITGYFIKNAQLLTTLTIGNCNGINNITSPCTSQCPIKTLNYNARRLHSWVTFNMLNTLETVNLQNTVILDSECLKYTQIRELIIPDTVQTISKYAVSTCNKLQSVTIGSGVTSIDNYAFYYNQNLSSVSYNGVEYTSKSALETALVGNGVTLGTGVFNYTALEA